MAQRNPTVDVARGISILLVVVGHSWIMLDHAEANRMLGSFRMPLFFFLAGVFLKIHDGTSEFVRTKSDALLKPYFVVLLAIGLLKLPLGKHGDALTYFAGVFYASGYNAAWGHLWFLPHLFLTLLAARTVLRYFMPRPMSPWLVASGLVVLMYAGVAVLSLLKQPLPLPLDHPFWRAGTPLLLPGLPFSADLVPVTMVFVICGHLLAQRVKSFVVQPVWLAASLAVFLLLHDRYNDSMYLFSRAYDDPFTVTLEAACGIYLTLCAARGLSSLPLPKAFLSHCGRSSLFILIFHSPVQNIVTKLLWHDPGRSAAMKLPSFAIAFALGVAVPLLLLAIAQRSKLLSAWLLPLPKRRSTPVSTEPSPATRIAG